MNKTYKSPIITTLLFIVVSTIWLALSGLEMKSLLVYIVVTAAMLFALVLRGIASISESTRNITSQKALEKALTESRERYKSLYEHNFNAIYSMDFQGCFFDGNSIFERVTGYSVNEIRGASFELLIVPDYKETTIKHFRKAAQGEPQQYESAIYDKKGQMIPLMVTNVPIIVNNEIVGVFGVAMDLTEAKQSQKALMESEERYRMVVELSPECMIVHRDGEIVYANPAARKCMNEDHLFGRSIFSYIHSDYVEWSRQRVAESVAGTELPFVEMKLIRGDGLVIDVEIGGMSMIYEGMPAILTMFRDVTEKKQIEQALKQSEEMNRLIAENMTDLVVMADVNGVLKYASPSHASVLGIVPEAYEGTPVGDWIHPDDLPVFQIQFNDMVETKEVQVIEYRCQHASGKWVWVEAKTTPVWDDDGNLLHVLIVSREIMDRKHLEEKLSYMAYHDPLTGIPNRRLFHIKLEQALKEAMQNKSKLAVMYMDLDKFKDINDTLGHDAGDELLKQFSLRVQECLRGSDTLARQGGDEFTIILQEIKEEKDAIHIAERILASAQEPWYIGEHVFYTTSSIGIAFHPLDGMTSGELMKCADNALYEAKQQGRNNIKTYIT